MDKAVFDTIKALQDGTLTLGDDYLGTIANGGVGLAPFHNFDSKVSDELKGELDQIAKDIAAGKINTKTGEVMAAREPQLMIGQVTDVGGIDDKSFNQTAWKGRSGCHRRTSASTVSSWRASSRPTTRRTSTSSSRRRRT